MCGDLASAWATEGVTQTIIALAASDFGVAPEEVSGPSLKRGRAHEARRMAMYLARRLTGETFHHIGQQFGRDHSTVQAACESVRALVDGEDEQTRAAVRRIEAQFFRHTRSAA